MTKQVDVGLFFGESFYEVIFIERPSDAILFSGSFFNLKDPFKSRLPKIMQSLEDVKIESVFVSYRYLERIFKFKLGGSVAQVVSKGFENWLNLHQHNKVESIFSLKSAPDLSSLDMVFPIENPLDAERLEALVSDLKKKEAKRICLNLVNSKQSPEDHAQLKRVLEENQFEVFDALNFDSENDISAWRTNLIEASLAGTFNEMKSEITEAFQAYAPKSISLLANKFGGKNYRNILSGLFAIEDSFFDLAKTKYRLPDQFDVVHLGLENFSVWLNETSEWQSPWGPTSIQTKKRIDLKVQPTNSFHLNSFDEVEISDVEESFEPGPMCLGRGKIPCVYDIINNDSTAPELQKKIKDSFWALARSASGKHTAEKAFDDFQYIIWNRILVEAQFLVRNETIVFYGNWPSHFEKRAREKFKSQNLIFISQKAFPKAWLPLLKGRMETT